MYVRIHVYAYMHIFYAYILYTCIHREGGAAGLRHHAPQGWRRTADILSSLLLLLLLSLSLSLAVVVVVVVAVVVEVVV